MSSVSLLQLYGLPAPAWSPVARHREGLKDGHLHPALSKQHGLQHQACLHHERPKPQHPPSPLLSIRLIKCPLCLEQNQPHNAPHHLFIPGQAPFPSTWPQRVTTLTTHEKVLGFATTFVELENHAMLMLPLKWLEEKAPSGRPGSTLANC